MTYDVVVVGAGIMGCATAYWLARRGRRVLVVDKCEPGHAGASSSDEARFIRYEYRGREIYTEMVARSVRLWKDFERETDREFYREYGMLALQSVPDYAPLVDGFKSLVELGYEPQWLDRAEIRRRFPQFENIDSGLFTEGFGGYIFAKSVLHALAARASEIGTVFKNGVDITDVIETGDRITGVRDTNGMTYEAGAFAIAAGPWTRRLLPDLRIPVAPTAARSHYLAPSDPVAFTHPRFVPFAVVNKLYYGIPVHWNGALKLADDEIGPEFDPDADRDGQDPIALAKLQEFLRTHIPGLANAAVVKSKICTYSMTPDADFIIDALPGVSNAFVAAGFSGHGFKFGILIGQIMSDLVIRGQTEQEISAFRLDRNPQKVNEHW